MIDAVVTDLKKVQFDDDNQMDCAEQLGVSEPLIRLLFALQDRAVHSAPSSQICIGVNMMDYDTAADKRALFDKIAREMRCMTVKVGWKKDFIE